MADVDPTETVDPPVDPHWSDTLPDDLRSNELIQRTPNVRTMAKRFVDQAAEMSKRPGKNAVVVPAKNASAEAKAEFRQRMGIPEEATGYDLGPEYRVDPKRPEQSAVKLDPERVASFQGMAHEAGLTQAQARRVWDGAINQGFEMARVSQQRQQQAQADSMRKLEAEFGDQLEMRTKSTGTIRQMCVSLGEDGTENADEAARYEKVMGSTVFEAGFGADADAKWVLFKIAEATSSERFVPGQPGNIPTPAGTKVVQVTGEVGQPLDLMQDYPEDE